jgi:arsenate reductase
VEKYRDSQPNLVVTVCGDAEENCPVWLGNGNKVHIGFDDPAKATGSEDERLAVFRRVRNEIRAQVLCHLASVQ